jgi:transposase-like protein
MPKQLNEFAAEQPELGADAGANLGQATPDFDSDNEGAMAKADLFKLAKYSLKLFKQMDDNEQLEAWVQAKITKAADYVASVYHYLEYEMKFSEYGSKLENSDVYSESEKLELKNKLMEAKEKLKTLKVTQAEVMEAKKAKKDYDGDGKVESGKDEYLGSKIKAAKKAGKMDEGMGGDMCPCEACGGTGQVQAPVKEWSPEAKTKAATYNRKAKAYAAAAKRIDRNKNGIPDSEEVGTEPKDQAPSKAPAKKPAAKKEAKPAEKKTDSAGTTTSKASSGVGTGVYEGAKPDFLDVDKDGDKKEPMKKAVKDKKKTVKEGVMDAVSNAIGDFVGTDASLERRSPQLQQLIAMRKKYADGTPEAKQLDARIKAQKDRLSMDQGEVTGQGGMPKDVVDPTTFKQQNPNFKYEESMNESAELTRMKEFLTRLNG